MSVTAEMRLAICRLAWTSSGDWRDLRGTLSPCRVSANEEFVGVGAASGRDGQSECSIRGIKPLLHFVKTKRPRPQVAFRA